MSFPAVVSVLVVAAILGDQCNYSIGRYFGPRVFQWEQSRFFNKAAFDKAHNFYETYGGFTIIAARFMPFLRTFVPFVGGVAEMNRAKFTFFNVVGAVVGALAANFRHFMEYIQFVVVVVFIHNGLALVTGYSLSTLLGLNNRDRRSVTFEMGIQNSGLGLILIFNLFEGLGGMAIITAWWGIWHIVSGLTLATYWSRRDPLAARA